MGQQNDCLKVLVSWISILPVCTSQQHPDWATVVQSCATDGKKAVLFVCLGNICRSPTAEAVFTDVVKKAGVESQFMIDSCGTGGGSPDWYLPGGFSYHEGTQHFLSECILNHISCGESRFRAGTASALIHLLCTLFPLHCLSVCTVRTLLGLDRTCTSSAHELFAMEIPGDSTSVRTPDSGVCRGAGHRFV